MTDIVCYQQLSPAFTIAIIVMLPVVAYIVARIINAQQGERHD